MEQPLNSVPVLSISDINDLSGRDCLGNHFHVTCSLELTSPPKYEKPVKGDHFVFMLALAGTITMKYNLMDYEIRPNDLFIITPGIIHEFHTGDDGQLIVAGFTNDFFSRSLIHKKHPDVFNFLFTNNNPHFKLTSEEAATLQNLMTMLKTGYSNKEHAFKEDIVFHGFNLFMLEAATIFKKHRQAQAPDTRSNRKEELMMTFLQLLATFYNTERSVQFYADKIFVTPKHLTRVVKEVSGKTVGEFIDEMVIAEAKILLDLPSLTIGEISSQLNFNNQFSFSKFFKNHTGLSPSQFRL